MVAARQTVPHLRLTWGGWLGASSGGEIWTCGLKFVPAGSSGNAPSELFHVLGEDPLLPVWEANLLQSISAAVAGTGTADLTAAMHTYCVPAIKTMHTAISDNLTGLTFVKLNAFGADDHQVTNPTIEEQFSAVTGNSAGDSPWSTSIDIYHRTSHKSKGFASHGRIQIPGGFAVDRSTGRARGYYQNSPGAIDSWSTAYGTFLSSLNMSIGGTVYAPAIVYTVVDNESYKVSGVERVPQASIIDQFVISDIPGETRSRQNKLRRVRPIVTVQYGGTQAPAGG